jgi:hypothetical protein
MDASLAILGAVIVVSAASAAVWHSVVKSYVPAVAGSALTVALATYLAYPVFRHASPGAFIVADAFILGAVFAVVVGIPFKRRRAAALAGNSPSGKRSAE